MSDKRAGERLTINLEFRSFEDFINEYATNLSSTGVFLRSATPAAVGTTVTLHFSVLVDGHVETIDGVGRVTRVQTDPPGMGLAFEELTEGSRALIDRVTGQRG